MYGPGSTAQPGLRGCHHPPRRPGAPR